MYAIIMVNIPLLIYMYECMLFWRISEGENVFKLLQPTLPANRAEHMAGSSVMPPQPSHMSQVRQQGQVSGNQPIRISIPCRRVLPTGREGRQRRGGESRGRKQGTHE